MKPILFSTPMVQAILAGQKTMTRRVIKPQTVTHSTSAGMVEESLDAFVARNKKDAELLAAACSPYRPGDILWVRETWAPFGSTYLYKANGGGAGGGRWRPSIHMPRKAARIFLRVTDVRMERLQAITDNDARAEGFEGVPCDHPVGRYACEDCMNTGYLEPPAIGFADVWDVLYNKRGYGWHANPWVWVISFERCEETEERE